MTGGGAMKEHSAGAEFLHQPILIPGTKSRGWLRGLWSAALMRGRLAVAMRRYVATDRLGPMRTATGTPLFPSGGVQPRVHFTLTSLPPQHLLLPRLRKPARLLLLRPRNRGTAREHAAFAAGAQLAALGGEG